MNTLSKRNIHSPLGIITLIASVRGLCALSFEDDQKCSSTVQKFKAYDKWTNHHVQTLTETEHWLDQYFAKKSIRLHLPMLDLQGTAFLTSAWQKLLEVGFGKTLSYGELAKKLGSPNASRAIGRAMGQNPIPILVPCHRIIGANRTLTGYSAGLHRKIWLLEHEGFLIDHE